MCLTEVSNGQEHPHSGAERETASGGDSVPDGQRLGELGRKAGRTKVKRPSITLDVRVDIHQAVAIEESNMLALVDGRPARMQRLGLLPISA